MTRNEFQSMSYPTTARMLNAIASEYLSAGGLNSEEQQAEFLAASTDAELAAECIWGFGLDRAADIGDEPSHMEFNDYTVDDLAAAFADLRG